MRYTNPQLFNHPFIRLAQFGRNRCGNIRTNEKTNGDTVTNVGSMKIMGEETERPGMGSNQIRMIPSLHKSFQNNKRTHRFRGLTELDADRFCEE
jgi:hypothetical protein